MFCGWILMRFKTLFSSVCWLSILQFGDARWRFILNLFDHHNVNIVSRYFGWQSSLWNCLWLISIKKYDFFRFYSPLTFFCHLLKIVDHILKCYNCTAFRHLIYIAHTQQFLISICCCFLFLPLILFMLLFML